MKNTDHEVYNVTPTSNWLQGVITEDMVGSGLEEGVLACGRRLMERRLRPQHEQALKCPRCESMHTKFCYYNNYSLSQPRYFCKTCRRYWTKGGTLRNIPVDGGCRKNTRKSSCATSSLGVAATSKKPLNDYHNSTPSSSVSILNHESNSLPAFPLSIFSSDQTNSGDMLSEKNHFNPRLLTPARFLLENPSQISAEQGCGLDLVETKNDTLKAAAGADLFSAYGIMAAANKYPSTLRDIYGPCLSLDHSTAGALDDCMLPSSGHGAVDVKIFSGNLSTGKNSFGYNIGGLGWSSGFMDGSSSIAH